jgi:mono/diheme cytochrome c family protein
MKQRSGIIVSIMIAGSMGGFTMPAAAQGQGAPQNRANAPAVYTASQATAGAAVFTQACAVCHGPTMEGLAGPALKGDMFREMAAAQQLTADSLLTVTSMSMPQSDPGSLSPEQYNQVVAYILQQNGYPAGDTPLAPGAPHLKDLQLK